MGGCVRLVRGRPAVEDAQPGIAEALEELVSPATRGDPCSPLRWTTKSLGQLVKALYAMGFVVSKTTAARLLKQAGYRLQAAFKTEEGAQHPDRDAQFGHINTLAGVCLPDSALAAVTSMNGCCREASRLPGPGRL